MLISEFINRLETLKGVAGDVEVTVAEETGHFFETAAAEIQHVVPHKQYHWESLRGGNTHMVVSVF